MWGPFAIGPLVAVKDGRTYEARRELVKRYAWAIPTARVIRQLARFSPIVEVGAGTGYWAWMLKQAGAHVLPYDLPTPEPCQVSSQRWTELLVGTGQEVADRHSDCTLFICWPTYDDPWSGEALATYRGSRVVYVGEGSGGCTGDKVFHEMLDTQWEERIRLDIPQWEGIHDAVWVYRRKRG